MIEPFLFQFSNLLEKEEKGPISEFVNNWIKTGGTFRTLYQWTLLKGLEFKYITVYINLRKFLIIPYESKNQYMYKWNEIAKVKGYASAKHMVFGILRNFTVPEAAIELGVDKFTFRKLKRRVEIEGNNNPKKITKRSATKDGIKRADTNKRWKKRWESKGYKGLRDAIKKMRLRRLSFKEIAKEFNVSIRGLRIRMRACKIKPNEFPKEKKLFKKY